MCFSGLTGRWTVFFKFFLPAGFGAGLPGELTEIFKIKKKRGQMSWTASFSPLVGE